jgi:hypothetical protein
LNPTERRRPRWPTESSVKKGIVGMGGGTQDTLFNGAGEATTL